MTIESAKNQNQEKIVDTASTNTKTTKSDSSAGDKKAVNPQTPKATKYKEGDMTSDKKAQSAPQANGFAPKPKEFQGHNTTGKKGQSKYHQGRQKNFYNPPGKVLRHLAQQSYYDNFYGNQGQFYTLKQKYKTQLCRHFTETGACPLDKYCQFAHGQAELRAATDALPKNFGKTALGAVHSNYKTIPCKYWMECGACKFADSCSFYHGDAEKRRLIDPLPNLPEGVTLPPMPEKLRNTKGKYHGRRYNKDKAGQQNGEYSNNGVFLDNNAAQASNFLQLTNIADIAAIGGFNPGKYLTSASNQPYPNFTAPVQAFAKAGEVSPTEQLD